MNKEELEKVLEDTFNCECINGNTTINHFIFGSIIKEALKSVIPPKRYGGEIEGDEGGYERELNIGYNSSIRDIKQKAKALYGIEL